MKKILFFVSNLNGGGAQRTIINIINNLDRRRYDVKLVLLKYSSNQSYAHLVPKDVDIVNLNRRGRYSIYSIMKVIKENKPDIIFSTLSETNIAVSIAHKIIKSNSKLILRETCHKSKKSLGIMKYRLLKFAYNQCDVAVGLSKGVSKELNQLYNIPMKKIHTIYNPVNIDYIKNSIITSQKPELDEKVFNMVACGRLVEQKNFSLLIKALGKVNEEYKNWSLHIIGEGEQKQRLVNLAHENNVSTKVIFQGFQKNPYKYMSSADLFVLSSKKEGFGHVIVEAMACGTPVLSTDCPHGPSEIINNKDLGWLAKNDNLNDLIDKLKTILTLNKENIVDKEVLVKNRANDFDVKEIVDRYEKLFEGIY